MRDVHGLPGSEATHDRPAGNASRLRSDCRALLLCRVRHLTHRCGQVPKKAAPALRARHRGFGRRHGSRCRRGPPRAGRSRHRHHRLGRLCGGSRRYRRHGLEDPGWCPLRSRLPATRRVRHALGSTPLARPPAAGRIGAGVWCRGRRWPMCCRTRATRGRARHCGGAR